MNSWVTATSPRLRIVLVRWLPPLVAYAAANAVFWQASSQHGFIWTNAGVRVRWDSWLYLKIASDGYDVTQCAPGTWGTGPGGAPSWCGDSGWFPAYSVLVRAVYMVGL